MRQQLNQYRAAASSLRIFVRSAWLKAGIYEGDRLNVNYFCGRSLRSPAKSWVLGGIVANIASNGLLSPDLGGPSPPEAAARAILRIAFRSKKLNQCRKAAQKFRILVRPSLSSIAPAGFHRVRCRKKRHKKPLIGKMVPLFCVSLPVRMFLPNPGFGIGRDEYPFNPKS